VKDRREPKSDWTSWAIGRSSTRSSDISALFAETVTGMKKSVTKEWRVSYFLINCLERQKASLRSLDETHLLVTCWLCTLLKWN
jgi:hypothetical protein